ncbi:MAG: (2Fe-2S)-binding protein [Ilumatobacteraceae bacterium]
MSVETMDTSESVGATTAVEFALNGTTVTVRQRHPHLLSALRDELNVTSPKDGCSPSGQCGCCTVIVNGKAVVSCQTPLSKVAGGTVTTLEGFTDGERRSFAESFAACGGLHCWFCIPGIVGRATALIDMMGDNHERD